MDSLALRRIAAPQRHEVEEGSIQALLPGELAGKRQLCVAIGSRTRDLAGLRNPLRTRNRVAVGRRGLPEDRLSATPCMRVAGSPALLCLRDTSSRAQAERRRALGRRPFEPTRRPFRDLAGRPHRRSSDHPAQAAPKRNLGRRPSGTNGPPARSPSPCQSLRRTLGPASAETRDAPGLREDAISALPPESRRAETRVRRRDEHALHDRFSYSLPCW
jgi:hypothetical protein